MKFGGTSVGSPERMKNVAKLITQNSPAVVVLSAVSGTTNKLLKIAGLLHQKKMNEAQLTIQQLENEYLKWPDQLYSTPEFKKQAFDFLASHFNFIRSFTVDLFTQHEENSLVAQGELLSTGLFQLYLDENSVSSELIPALEFMRLNTNAEPDFDYIEQHLNTKIEKSSKPYIITQGFICRTAYGEISNLKRGGSDYTASIIGAAINAVCIEIWTDIDGMHNNDPRVVENTSPVNYLSFDEAAELAYFGAKILHPASVGPARDKQINVWLKNTMQPEAFGTLISSQRSNKGITAIAAKDGITVVHIKSGRMLMAYGFLRKVFEIFERYKTPIDMITTSEVAVSLTIDDASQLNAITEELILYGTVNVEQNQTIICVVGDMMTENKGLAGQIFNALMNIPIRMISYGGSQNNISLVVDQQYKDDSLKTLHQHLFLKKEQQ